MKRLPAFCNVLRRAEMDAANGIFNGGQLDDLEAVSPRSPTETPTASHSNKSRCAYRAVPQVDGNGVPLP
ncbi:hypothetical protein M1D89_01555 (plasmid) [Arthrobacter sp. D3-18]